MEPQLRIQPEYCQYADGPCDQDFSNYPTTKGFFLFPSNPPNIAATIESTIELLKNQDTQNNWHSWRTLPIHGQIIFCEICKAIRHTESIVADVTTLNFNLLFEIGYAIGLGIPVIPIRDTSYITHKREFEELGLIDVLGYVDFTNSPELASILPSKLPGKPLPTASQKIYQETPLYVLKGHIPTDGTIQLMSAIKKAGLRFRSYDPIENPRLSLQEAIRNIGGSIGVIAHLLSPNRQGAHIHNGRSALLCGLAMAKQKIVLMLQEENILQPIDYRDVVRTFTTPAQIPRILERYVVSVVQVLQQEAGVTLKAEEKLLERLDLGDTAAENEIGGLRQYFVQTGQFTRAKQGHARLVIGRKGTGKTAIFYAVRNWLGKSHSKLILDLKPEGHQFTTLRENVLQHLSAGLQEHTMTAFWNYILLSEIAHKIIEIDISYSQRDPDRASCYQRLKSIYEAHGLAIEGDLSQRLLRQVDRLTERFQEIGSLEASGQLTQLIYGGDIRELDQAVSDYLKEKDSVWLLIDNLDKGWPVRGTSSADILIVRSLLEATRKLQRQLEDRDVEFKCLVFLRTDIYDHLVGDTPDKGKDTTIRLDYDDPRIFQDIVHQRILSSTELDGEFNQLWANLFEPLIGGQESFSYLMERTLMRPRDLLLFLNRCIEVAINRKHEKVTPDDISQAERSYSEDMLLTTAFEIGDICRNFQDILYAFQGSTKTLTKAEIEGKLKQAGLDEKDFVNAIELLAWFGFLGVAGSQTADDNYAYQFGFNLRHLLHPIEQGISKFTIHPCFREALAIH